MANGFGSFYVGNSGLQSAQNALNVTANNLANVNTTGYVREQVIFSDKQYQTFRQGTATTNIQQNGLGVSIGDVVHARDIFLDKAYRLENGRSAFYSTSYTTVEQIYDLFQEMNGQEFKECIKDLSTAFQELAKAPGDSVNQNLVIQKSELFVSRSQALYSDLQSYQSNMNEQIKEAVERINEIGDRVYELNLYIQKVESGSVETAMTARDERDALLDELASYGNVSTREDQYGFVWVDFEGAEFIQEYGCNNIALKADNGTGFYTPYWPHLSDTAHQQYVSVCRVDTDISSENNTDIGSLKALVYHRGTGYGRYTDLEDPQAYKAIEDCVMMETEAQIDLLFHTMVTSLNDLFCPNTTAGEDLGIAQGQTVTAYDAAGHAYTISSDTKVLDSKNCNVGADKELPPQELFARLGCERYTTVTYTDADGKQQTAYLYNEENPNDSSTMYQIGSVQVNSALLQQETLLPTWQQNGAVDYNLGDRISETWSAQGMLLNPKDNSPSNFQGYYDRVISNLGTAGNVYYSESQTLGNTVNSLNNQRLQVMGVSSDEELTNMVRYQAAYNAASRYISVISEMTQLIVTGLI